MNNGIQPTVELATNNGTYPYPIYPYGNNNDGFFGGDGIWAIILLALLFGNGGWGGIGGFGGFGGGFGNMFEFPWLLNGQQQIMSNTNDGFDTLHLSNQVEGVRDSLGNIATQICGSTADIVSAVNTSAYNAEISANNRQMANMQQAFNSEISTLNGFNNINNALQNCCCENRLATCQTQNIVQSEGNQTRFADANNTRDIIDSQTRGTQAILDKLCQLELDNVKLQVDAKNDRIAELQRELSMKDLQASQTAQNAFIAQGFANEVDSLYNRLNSCPVPSTPVFGRTPIFTCNGNNNGCGCNGYNQFI